MKAAKILFFINGPFPTKEDIEEKNEIKADVVFRNAQKISDEEGLEPCDGVAGAVPESYKGLPSAKEAIAAHAKALKALTDKVGDVPAPKRVQTPAAQPAGGAKPNAPATGSAPAWNPNPPQ